MHCRVETNTYARRFYFGEIFLELPRGKPPYINLLHLQLIRARAIEAGCKRASDRLQGLVVCHAIDTVGDEPV